MEIGGITGVGKVGGGASGGLGQLPGMGQAGGLGQLGAGGDGQQAGGDDSATFGDMLRSVVLEKPTQSHAIADDLATRFAAGESIDPHNLAIATAKAGVEVQMATRTISQAVSAVRTLFQMQI